MKEGQTQCNPEIYSSLDRIHPKRKGEKEHQVLVSSSDQCWTTTNHQIVVARNIFSHARLAQQHLTRPLCPSSWCIRHSFYCRTVA